MLSQGCCCSDRGDVIHPVGICQICLLFFTDYIIYYYLLKIYWSDMVLGHLRFDLNKALFQ